MKSSDDKMSNFDLSICELAERTDSIPRGWIRPFVSALVSLFAVRCDARAHIRLSGPFIADTSLIVSHDDDDQVVTGITRKLAVATGCTCEQCSRSGVLRIMGKELQVLCAVCAAPRLMRFEIDSMLLDQIGKRSDASSVQSYDDVPAILRSTIPTSSWQIRRGPSELTLHITLDEMKRLRPRFETIRQALNAEIVRQAPR